MFLYVLHMLEWYAYRLSLSTKLSDGMRRLSPSTCNTELFPYFTQESGACFQAPLFVVNALFLALRLTPQWARDRRQACRPKGRRLRGLSVARGLAAGAAGGRP